MRQKVAHRRKSDGNASAALTQTAAYGPIDKLPCLRERRFGKLVQKSGWIGKSPFPDYPFTLWLDILPFRSDRGIGAVTMGLAAFAGREIEFETAKLPFPAMIDKVAGLSAYLVEHGNVVKDGDTFGGDERERFAVRYKNSDRFGGMPVFFCAAD
jgi:hypothetical protein